MKHISRRTVMAGGLALPAIARAQSAWPSGTITLVVPAPAGGSVDIIARLAQPGLQQRLKVPVVVENRSGAATSLGAAFVAKGPRDGSRWLINADPQALNPAFMATMPFDTEKDLDPILLIGTSPNAIAVHPSKPHRTLADVLAAARQPPGVSYAVLADTLALLSMILLNRLAGTHLMPVTYRAATQVVNDVIGGHVELLAGSASLLAPYFAGGQLRPLAQTGATRHPALPDVPTVGESGFPGFAANSFWGFYAPSGTDPVIVGRFLDELQRTLREPEINERMRTTLMLDVTLAGPDEFKAFFMDQVRTWGQVIRENGLQRKS